MEYNFPSYALTAKVLGPIDELLEAAILVIDIPPKLRESIRRFCEKKRYFLL
jgi:hypothetical protein